MGGSGTYYDRGVSTDRKSSRGTTASDEKAMSRSALDRAILPKDRRLATVCKSPLCYGFDITGSMGNLPILIRQKWPMIAGQLVIHKYLDDPMVSLAGIGDVVCDWGPLQVCDFSEIKKLDEWLEKLWLEGEGGGQAVESYEFMAYFYARFYDMSNAEQPIFIFTGDEGFREQLFASELEKRFGGKHEGTQATTIFAELKAKFKGNVFLLHRYYSSFGKDPDIVSQWEGVLGKGYVVKLPEDPAVADLTLGVIALVSGKRTLKDYVEDMKSRPLEMDGRKYKPQSEERIKMVVEALEPLEEMLKSRQQTGQLVGEKPRKTGKPPAQSKRVKKSGLKF